MAEKIADLALSSVVQVLIDKLTNFMSKKIGNLTKSIFDKFGNQFMDFQNSVKKLKRTLPMVQALLEDAEEQQVTKPAVRIWLSKLKDLAYDAEVLFLQLCANDSLLNREHADKVNEVLLALEKVAEEGLGFNLRATTVTDHREWGSVKESFSSVIESEVYGRDEDREKIVELLLSSEATQGEGTVSCIPIIGLGGLGKTTLAQLAFNDENVDQRFDVKVWIFVSLHFDVKNILIRVIESITEAKWELSALDEAHRKVRKLLQNKRYLIVLDDVWTEDSDDWDSLRKALFGTGIKGSRILITCRSGKVSEALGKTGFPTVEYDLPILSNEISWSLFKQRAFDRGEGEKYPTLLPVGKQIVNKCGGLPLAANILGSLMRFKRDIKEWLFVRDSELWNVDGCENKILAVLKLSYSNLPLHLKRCFLFCSIFPRSFEFKKEKLIHLWMAEGLVQHNNTQKDVMPDSNTSTCWMTLRDVIPDLDYITCRRMLDEDVVRGLDSITCGRTLEDVGNGYFTDLERMSFFLEIKDNENGIVTEYKMHDIIYDLLQSISSSEYAKLGRGFPTPSCFKRIRHSCICDFSSSTIPEALYEAGHHLRTLLLYSEGNFNVLPEKLYSSLNCLFVLDLSGSGLIKLEGSIGALSHLTYLDLSHTHITELPPQIEGLEFLQTLNLLNCYNLLALPDFRKMARLRHLINEGCRKLTRMLESEGRDVKRIDVRKQLQTLPLFVVGGDFDMKFLEILENLQGSFKITHLENINDIEGISSFCPGNQIESLELCWGSDDGWPSINTEREYVVSSFQERKETESSGPSQEIQHDPLRGEEVLEKLILPTSLKRLLIKGYPGFKFPKWNFQFLTNISMREMHEVRCIGKEFYYEGNGSPFPVLKELILVDFPNLKEWFGPDSGGNAFPNLRKLILNKCPQLIVMPQILSLHHLDLRDCCETLLGSFRNLRSLETLVIEGVEDLFSFPDAFPISNHLLRNLEIKSCPSLCRLPDDLENLGALKSLVIRSCGKLNILPRSLQYLSALESLEIGDCHSLKSLPDRGNRGLSNLRSLSIENCDKLKSLSMGFRHLTSLEILTIMCCPSIAELPESVKHLSALRRLSILWCKRLTSLPEELQSLMVLNSLEIGGCPELEVLPEWIQKHVSLRSVVISDCRKITFLPEGIEHLTALQHLSIQDCPQLQKRCRPESGEDWPKIAHVPHKHIELPKPKRPREEGSSSSNH